MLTAQQLLLRARAAQLRPRPELVDAAAPALMSAFRLRERDQAAGHASRLEQDAMPTLEERTASERRIEGDENFAELWPKLVKCGWSYQKGKGLETWKYQRPGVADAAEARPLTKRATGPEHPHIFTNPADLLAFVAMAKLDGIERVGHINEVYQKQSPKKAASARGGRSDAALARASNGLVTASGIPASTHASRDADASKNIREGAKPAAILHIESTNGWAKSRALFGFGAHPSNEVRLSLSMALQ